MKATFSIATATALVLASLTLLAPVSVAQEASANAEECSTWGFIQDINYEFGVVNTCAYPIAVWFLSGTGVEAHGEVAPGRALTTGQTPQNADLNQWMSAVCRAGYHSNIEVTPENGDAIVASRYSCVQN